MRARESNAALIWRRASIHGADRCAEKWTFVFSRDAFESMYRIGAGEPWIIINDVFNRTQNNGYRCF